jgi:predicted helicase
MTPRIVLTYQLLGETMSYLKAKNIDAQYLNLNSGVFDDDAIKEAMAEQGLPIRDVPSTTTVKEIEFYYEKAVKDKVPFIISATYQSAPRILSTKIPIHMAIHDEAHNLVDGIGRFSTTAKIDVLSIEGAKEIFLTATPAFSASDNGTGMNNEKEYGKEIYRKSPKEMIDAGEIVPPYIHQVIIDEYKMKKNKAVALTNDNLMSVDIEKDVEFMTLVIEESFNEHNKKVKQYSCKPEKIGAKMLVVCRGDDTFQGFFASEGFKIMKENRKDIKFFGISSKFGAWIDGEQVPVQGGWYKEQFMLALRNLKQEDNAIILHIDILGEGVDVPGITGVLPFRDLGTIKSCQTLGRAMRLVPEDRMSFYNGDREARDTSKMIKPFAWVVIPVYSINHKDMEERVMKIAKQIRDDIGFSPFEMGDSGTGGGTHIDLQTNPSKGKRPDELTIKHVVENPYFTCLTEKAINDSINGNDEVDAFFAIIKKMRL